MFQVTPINPFYRAAPTEISSFRQPTLSPPVYAKLPAAPRTGSPVPHLTSLYHFSRAGEYGSRDYPGNCGGNLIKDLLRFFRPATVFDPMTGSGTCRDVCRELAIPCVSTDLKSGFDASDPNAYRKFCQPPSLQFFVRLVSQRIVPQADLADQLSVAKGRRRTRPLEPAQLRPDGNLARRSPFKLQFQDFALKLLRALLRLPLQFFNRPLHSRNDFFLLRHLELCSSSVSFFAFSRTAPKDS